MKTVTVNETAKVTGPRPVTKLVLVEKHRNRKNKIIIVLVRVASILVGMTGIVNDVSLVKLAAVTAVEATRKSPMTCHARV